MKTTESRWTAACHVGNQIGDKDPWEGEKSLEE
jgi:hypothetical protein